MKQFRVVLLFVFSMSFIIPLLLTYFDLIIPCILVPFDCSLAAVSCIILIVYLCFLLPADISCQKLYFILAVPFSPFLTVNIQVSTPM